MATTKQDKVKTFVAGASRAKRKGSDSSPTDIVFKLVDSDGEEREITAHRPKDAAFVFLQHAAETENQVLEVMRFLDACLDPADREYVRDRLRDPDDKLDIDDLVDLFRWLVEQLTGNPTESQPA